MSYFGSHTIQLDEKSRMRIPAKFRKELGGRFFILQGFGGCLFVMNENEFENFISPFKKIPLSDLKGQEAVRKIMATVENPDEDSQGRFVLSPILKRSSGIDKKMVFVGVGERIEIWSEDKFNDKNIGEESSLDEAADCLKEYDI